MFQIDAIHQPEAIVAPASDPNQNQEMGQRSQVDDMLHMLAEQQRISGVRDQDQLLKILADPQTNTALYAPVLVQLGRFGNENAIEPLSEFVLSAKYPDMSRHHAFAVLCSIVLEHPEARAKMGEVIHEVLSTASQPQDLRRFVGYMAVITGHPDAKSWVQEALSNPNAPASLRLLAASVDPTAGAPIVAAIAGDVNAQPDDRARAIVQQAMLDPSKVPALQSLILNVNTPEGLCTALLCAAGKNSGLISNAALLGVMGREALGDEQRTRAACTLAKRAGPGDAQALRVALDMASESGLELGRQSLINSIAKLGLPEDYALMQQLVEAPGGNESALRYFTKVDPEFALTLARKFAEFDPAQGNLISTRNEALVTLAALGNDQDVTRVFRLYSTLEEHAFILSPRDRILDALAQAGQGKALDMLAAIYGE